MLFAVIFVETYPDRNLKKKKRKRSGPLNLIHNRSKASANQTVQLVLCAKDMLRMGKGEEPKSKILGKILTSGRYTSKCVKHQRV